METAPGKLLVPKVVKNAAVPLLALQSSGDVLNSSFVSSESEAYRVTLS